MARDNRDRLPTAKSSVMDHGKTVASVALYLAAIFWLFH